MKSTLLKQITAALFGLSLVVSVPAFAGHKHHGNKHGHGYSYNNHHYKSGYGHHGRKHYRSHRRSHHKAGHIIGGIIGGVILGNVIHHATTKHTYNRRYSNYNANVIVDRTPVTTYRFLNGKECYLVNINQAGNEILTQVPNINCGY